VGKKAGYLKPTGRTKFTDEGKKESTNRFGYLVRAEMSRGTGKLLDSHFEEEKTHIRDGA